MKTCMKILLAASVPFFLMYSVLIFLLEKFLWDAWNPSVNRALKSMAKLGIAWADKISPQKK